MPTPTEIRTFLDDPFEERGEVIRLFLSMLAIDTVADCTEFSELVGIEHPTAVWELAQRAKRAIETTAD